MSILQKHITLFEHDSIKLDQIIDGVKFDNSDLKALQLLYGQKGVPYFSLIHNGIKFNENVGVIQINNTIIEVLPKADYKKKGVKEKNEWRDILINMLFAVGTFDINSPSNSKLKFKSNSILFLYFQLLIDECEYLVHSGLIKNYHKKEGNVTSLKGRILFSKHIQQNLIHQERFYVENNVYDKHHLLHIILYKAIQLLKTINTNANLSSKIGTLFLNFPEMPDIKISEETFDRIVFNRKTQSYKKAIEIAKMLLLNFHPDISKGKNNVLALMFDMNNLWEKFIYISLRKHKLTDTTITDNTFEYFWKPKLGKISKIIPDIVINKNKEDCIVLDTKWKNLKDCNPSLDDLRQMFVYHEYYNAIRVALIYPGIETKSLKGNFINPFTGKEDNKECNIISIGVNPNIKAWQLEIYKQFRDI